MTGNQFALKTDGIVLYFDTDGEVWDAAKQVGKWTVDSSNSIVFTPADGSGNKVIPVTWRFDQDNYLWIDQSGSPVHQFGGDAAHTPKFTLDKNLLVVDPDVNDNNDFTFTLNCLWGMLDDGRLSVTIGKSVSQIDGVLKSADSGFTYWFKLADQGGADYWVLKFAGKWEQVDPQNDLSLHFLLTTPALEDPKHPLTLPADVGTSTKNNHLVFRYSRNGRNHLIEFQGTLQIQKDWTLAFTIRQSKTSGVTKSLIEVATDFKFDNDSFGNLQFYVSKQSGGGSQTLAIGGKVSYKIDKKTGLELSFAYTKQSGTTLTTTTSLAVAGKFYWDAGKSSVTFSFKRDKGSTQTMQLDVLAKTSIGPATIAGGLQIINDPAGRKVTAFLSVSF